MRKITNNNITNEVSKAINTTIKYLNTYNTTWNVEIMEFPNKYNIILKTDNVCFDLENIYILHIIHHSRDISNLKI